MFAGDTTQKCRFDSYFVFVLHPCKIKRYLVDFFFLYTFTVPHQNTPCFLENLFSFCKKN